jgi:hypothetical protein
MRSSSIAIELCEKETEETLMSDSLDAELLEEIYSRIVIHHTHEGQSAILLTMKEINGIPVLGRRK